MTPEGSLIFDFAGDLFGTTEYGSPFAGTVFRLKPPTQETNGWSFSILYGFTFGSDGRFPASTLIFDESGDLYGTTQEGGGKGSGTVFEVSP